MKKNSHIIWVCPTSDNFFRGKGEVKPRPNSVLPKLSEKGLRITVLIPYDQALLPKSKLAPARISRFEVNLSQKYVVECIKLTRAQVTPAIFMLKTPPLEPAIKSAVFAKSAIALAEQLNKPVELFHLFDWESSLLPLFLEMEKEKGHRELFDRTRTFLAVSQLKNQGMFSPEVLGYLGIPKTLFHPDGIEYYGKVSFLKTGLLFADGVGLVENPSRNGALDFAQLNGLSGLLDSMVHKLRRWASDRSLKSHLDAYQELMSLPYYRPLLPSLVRKLHVNEKAADRFVQTWGPVPPERYHSNGISFLIQSPRKAFVFWEWAHEGPGDFALRLIDHTTGRSRILARGLGAIGDFWLDVEPNHDYEVELVAFRPGAHAPDVLMRTPRIRTPLDRPSDVKDAVFVDVRDRRRMVISGFMLWDELMGALKFGSSMAGVISNQLQPSSWTGLLPSSWQGTVK